MLSLIELRSRIDSYRSGRVSLDEFEDWFRGVSRGMFGESNAVLVACIAVERGFSRLRFEDISEAEFVAELGLIALPVSSSVDSNVVVCSPRSYAPVFAMAAASAVMLWSVPTGVISMSAMGVEIASPSAALIGGPSRDRAKATVLFFRLADAEA
jgi:hypothetical protein